MGAWYDLGLTAGLAVAVAVAVSGLLAPIRRGTALVAIVGVAAGVAVGLAVFDWDEAVVGGLAGILGGVGAGLVASGALKRGGTRGGIALLLVAAGAVAAGLAFVPVVGYLEALALPLVAARIRKRGGGRYAGLRILAKD